jgi:hypothetical protein
MKKSQNQRVIDILNEHGCVTRNWCLRQYPAITRLSARIQDLEAMGYVFEPCDEHGDYVYKLISRPKAERLDLV